MATPLLTKHTFGGGLGPILVDARAPAGPSPRPAVVILHGFKGFKDYAMFPAMADRLARAGFTAVALNASGSGVDDRGELAWPERCSRNTFSLEVSDLLVVIAALERGALGPAPTSIGILGHSRGGGSAILAAAREPAVRTLVTWASISTVHRGQAVPLFPDALVDVEQDSEGRLDISRAAAGLSIPWLIVHGTADETVPYREAGELKSFSSRDDTNLLTIPGGTHGFGATHPYAGPTPDLERVFDATVSWFSRHLP